MKIAGWNFLKLVCFFFIFETEEYRERKAILVSLTASLFHRTASLFHRTASLFHRTASPYRFTGMDLPAPFVLPTPDTLPQFSGGRGGKSGKGKFLDHQRAWRLLLANCDRIRAGDTFESVYTRVKRFGPFYMEEWDTLWDDMAKNDCFNAVFRRRIDDRILSLGRENVRIGDLSTIEDIDWEWPAEISARVLHFLRDSDMLRVNGMVRPIENYGPEYPSLAFLDVDPRRMCLSEEQFLIFRQMTPSLMRCLYSLLTELLSKSVFLFNLIWLMTEMRRLQVWKAVDAKDDLLRFLRMNTGEEWTAYLELVEGTIDGVVLLDLPLREGVFESSWQDVVAGFEELDAAGIETADPVLLGALQYAFLEESASPILAGFDDACQWKTGDTVHAALNRRRAGGYFSSVGESGQTKDGKWKEYKTGYEKVRPMPSTRGKTLVVKPFEWAAVCLFVAGMDNKIQNLAVDFLQHKKKAVGLRLETELGQLCDIDAMVLYVRAWVKNVPLILRLWPLDLEASAETWTEMFQGLSGVGLESIGRMLEIKIYAAGQMLVQAQKTLARLLSLAITEMDDPFLDADKGIVPSLYLRLKPSHKRTRRELEDFLAFSVKRLRGCVGEDGPIGEVARRAIELAA